MDRHSLHDLLRQHRLAAGFTQQQLAERAGISTRSIGYLESGTGHIPRVDTLRLLAEALALSADEATHLLQAAVPMSGTSGNSSLVSHSIPLPPTLLVGRSGALEELCSLLKLSAARLLTLTGTGGVGKTHLALTLAHRMGATFPDGMTFVVDCTAQGGGVSAFCHRTGAPGPRSRTTSPSRATTAAPPRAPSSAHP